jgi:exo-beta-1,3-glucanase (GH17 family)
MEPVLTVGATYPIEVTFCDGPLLVSIFDTTLTAGIKIKSDYAGDIVAEDLAPFRDGQERVVFSVDLTTEAANAYFVANPTAESVNAVLVVDYEIDSVVSKTVPFDLVLQKNYFPAA